jgi:hypothetical protein
MGAIDHILQANGDLLVTNGDLVIDDATGQHQAILVMTPKGTIRQKGEAGVGAEGYLLDTATSALLRETSRQCLLDGMEVDRIDLGQDGEILIDAEYEDNEG